jgi:tetratricopeptide (TPR) repeat protein
VAVLPAIQEIARHDPRHAGVLSAVLSVLDPAAAETQLRAHLDDAAARGDNSAASVIAGELIGLCRRSGRLAEALMFAERKAEYSQRASLGPWTQLMDEVRKLDVLDAMGHADQVFAEVQRLRTRMDSLPAASESDEITTPWGVREGLLAIGRDAARHLSRWQHAIELNSALIASMRDRRAPAVRIARARFNDHEPLLSLGLTDEALSLLLDCRQIFDSAHDVQGIGNTLNALAGVEEQRGHGDAAIHLVHDALRYKYLAGDATAIAGSYYNLGNYLRKHARQPARVLASFLTAALICALASAGGTSESIRATALVLLESPAVKPPSDIADLCRMLGELPGTDPAALIAKICPDPEAAEQMLRDLIAQARTLIEASPGGTRLRNQKKWLRRVRKLRSG